jgi:hypothetical protein
MSAKRESLDYPKVTPHSKAEFFRQKVATFSDSDDDNVIPLISELIADRRRRKLMKQALPFYLAQRGYTAKARTVFLFAWALAEDESARLENGNLKAHYAVQYRYYKKAPPVQNRELNESERRLVREYVNRVEREQERIGGWMDLGIIRGSQPKGQNQATEFIPYFIKHLKAIAEIAERNPRMRRSSRHAVEYAVREYLECGSVEDMQPTRKASQSPKNVIAQARGMVIRAAQFLLDRNPEGTVEELLEKGVCQKG